MNTTLEQRICPKSAKISAATVPYLPPLPTLPLPAWSAASIYISVLTDSAHSALLENANHRARSNLALPTLRQMETRASALWQVCFWLLGSSKQGGAAVRGRGQMMSRSRRGRVSQLRQSGTGSLVAASVRDRQSSSRVSPTQAVLQLRQFGTGSLVAVSVRDGQSCSYFCPGQAVLQLCQSGTGSLAAMSVRDRRSCSYASL